MFTSVPDGGYFEQHQNITQEDSVSNVIEALASGGKRQKIHDAQLVTKVPQRAKDLVTEVAKKREVSDAVIVREALAEYFERRGYRA